MALYEFEGKKPVVGSDSYIHPEAVLIGSVAVGSGCFIGAGAVLRADFGDIAIGDGSNVQDNAVLHASPVLPVLVEQDAILAHGVLIHDATICRGSVIGMGAIILHGAKVEQDAVVAAGSVVSARFIVPERTLVAGNPAAVVKDVSDKFLEINRLGLAAYQELAGRYLKSARKIA